MKVIRVGMNKYRKASWFKEHEMFTYTLLAIIFWAVVLTAFII